MGASEDFHRSSGTGSPFQEAAPEGAFGERMRASGAAGGDPFEHGRQGSGPDFSAPHADRNELCLV